MKLLICSDIHGDLDSMNKIMSAYKNENADKILILGDLLYHGPRNDLPETYAPKQVIQVLNANKELLLCVRGNCDTEVDQMVLDLPILADYAYLELDGLRIFATHGHKFNKESMPPLAPGEILLHGHTHILCCQDIGKDIFYLNPGSCAIPKNGNPRSYMVYEKRVFIIKDFEGNILLKKEF